MRKSIPMALLILFALACNACSVPLESVEPKLLKLLVLDDSHEQIVSMLFGGSRDYFFVNNPVSSTGAVYATNPERTELQKIIQTPDHQKFTITAATYSAQKERFFIACTTNNVNRDKNTYCLLEYDYSGILLTSHALDDEVRDVYYQNEILYLVCSSGLYTVNDGQVSASRLSSMGNIRSSLQLRNSTIILSTGELERKTFILENGELTEIEQSLNRLNVVAGSTDMFLAHDMKNNRVLCQLTLSKDMKTTFIGKVLMTEKHDMVLSSLTSDGRVLFWVSNLTESTNNSRLLIFEPDSKSVSEYTIDLPGFQVALYTQDDTVWLVVIDGVSVNYYDFDYLSLR